MTQELTRKRNAPSRRARSAASSLPRYGLALILVLAAALNLYGITSLG